MTVKELLWLIECRIEGEKILPCSYHWSIEMDQGHYDNRDNLEFNLSFKHYARTVNQELLKKLKRCRFSTLF
jgi:hypothetical protein